jgi:hypothetical protein
MPSFGFSLTPPDPQVAEHSDLSLRVSDTVLGRAAANLLTGQILPEDERPCCVAARTR